MQTYDHSILCLANADYVDISGMLLIKFMLIYSSKRIVRCIQKWTDIICIKERGYLLYIGLTHVIVLIIYSDIFPMLSGKHI